MKSRTQTRSILMMGVSMIAASIAAPMIAQADENPAAKASETEVVITGYRGSLFNATKAKKNETNFTETIFAEDMGKFPDLNLAEALQRVPGMVIQKDALTGEGTNISVRALPASFTQVTMNGNRVAVASDFGFTGSSSPNRSVDLDMFPTELFNRIDVKKTPSADMLEGGIAGTVNIQNARPFDRKGTHVVFSVQDGYNMNARKLSPRAAFTASKTWDKFGILVGLTSTKKKIFSDGFETVGWTDPNLANFCPSCDPSNITGGGSNGFRFSNTVYPWSGNGLTAGALTEAQLLALNPSLTEATLKGAIFPRLGRNYLLIGDSKNDVGLVSMEYHATDKLKFTLDILGGNAKRNAIRTDMMWTVRSTGLNDGYNNGMIPLNMTVDSNDVVTSGTFADSAFLSETNNYIDKTGFGSVNFGFDGTISDTLKWDGEASATHSTYERDVTFLKFLTPANANITVTYKNDIKNDIPTINSNINLNDPNLGWRTFQVLLQRDMRHVDAFSAHTNLTKLLGDWTLKAGLAFDSYNRVINIHDNGSAFNTAFRTAIPDANLGQYLTSMTVSHYMQGVSGTGYTNFVYPDFNKVAAATNYYTYLNAQGSITTGTTYNGAGASNIREEIGGAYAQAAYRGDVFNVPVKSNFGLRYQTTHQTISAPSSINGQIVNISLTRDYHDVLPAFNAVANVTDKLNLRFAASRSMTRANPADMNPQLGYSDPGAQNASRGNPGLKPFYSNNIDFGGEYYTGGLGYVGLTVFTKIIQNFVYSKNIVVPFNSLGVDFSSLSTQQQTAINANGGIANWTVNLSTKANAVERLHLSGQEFVWVQPLDVVTKGLGYSVNYTHFNFSDVSLQAGIPDYTYNLTAFYEANGFSTHISYVKTGKSTIGLAPSANSIAYNWLSQERHQIDMSASYKFKAYGLDQSITLDAVNLDRQGYRTYYTLKNIPYTYNNPGTTILVGWRAQY